MKIFQNYGLPYVSKPKNHFNGQQLILCVYEIERNIIETIEVLGSQKECLSLNFVSGMCM